MSIQQQADLLARHTAQFQFGDDFAGQLLRRLAATDSDFAVTKDTSVDLLFRRAQRLVLALDRLSGAATREGSSAQKTPALTQLFEDVRSRTDFQAPRFAEHLRNFRATIERAPR